MLVHIGNSVAGSMAPDRMGELHGRFMGALNARLLAGLDKKLASIAAKKKPVAKPKAGVGVALRPAAKPMSRAARLRKAEAEVKATQPRDARCFWQDMVPA